MTGEEVPTGTQVCDCKKCDCAICKAALASDECACCAHGCSCCGDKTSETTCDCEDDCGCSGDNCNCIHGPCDSETCTCACGCGGHGSAHVCPICGMEVTRNGACACDLHSHNHRAGQDATNHPRSHTQERFDNLPPAVKVGIKVAAVSDLALKTIAIRRALSRNDKKWVLPLAIINSLGILPAYYLKTHPKE